MPTDAPQQRREECRGAVRAYLAERSTLAFPAPTIRGRLNANGTGDWSVEEVEAALEFLVGQGHVQRMRHPDGATRFYQITSAGTLAYERQS